MPMVGYVVAFLVLALAVVWIFKGFVLPPSSELVEVDTRAFRNVLSVEDSRALRDRLPAEAYRRIKRARVRAAQEYLKAVANNCAVTVAILRAHSGTANQAEISSLVNDSLRIRLLCLGFWIALWAEFIVPNLEIRPLEIAGSYERLRWAAERCLRSMQAPSSSEI